MTGIELQGDLVDRTATACGKHAVVFIEIKEIISPEKQHKSSNIYHLQSLIL